MDLNTAVPVIAAVSAAYVVVFVRMVRKHPSVGGPSRWMWAAACESLAVLLLGRPEVPVWLGAWLGCTLVVAGGLFNWSGICQYMRWTQPRQAPWLILLLASASTAAVVWWDAPVQWFLTVCFVSIAVIIALLARDQRLGQRADQALDLKALDRVLLLELLLIALLLPLIWWYLPSTPLDDLRNSWFFVLLGVYAIDTVLRMTLYFMLVTQRLQRDTDTAQQAVLNRQRRMTALMENLSAGVLVFRSGAVVSESNKVGLELLAFAGEDAGAWRWIDENERELGLLDRPIQPGATPMGSITDRVLGIRSKDGKKHRWILCNTYRQYEEDDSNEPLTVLTFIDVTARKEAQDRQKALEAELAQSQKMQALGTLASGVAHDFNNILAAILGNVTLINETQRLPVDMQQNVDQVNKAAQRGRDLVNQILAFSRQKSVALKPIDTSHLAKETLALLKLSVPGGVTLRVDIPDELPRMRADFTQMVQVLLNLGVNAVHALPRAGGVLELTVSAFAPDTPGLPVALADRCREQGVEVLCFTVQDNGSGMDAATLSRIFEPFFTTKGQGKGTGLGLSMVYGIVQSHEGEIVVQSTPGVGSRFDLFFAGLPVSTHTGDTQPADLAGSDGAVLLGSNRTPHILYVDDDPTIVFVVKRVLELKGWIVDAYQNPYEAVEAFKAQPDAFDLVLSDHQMPAMSGMDVARQVLELRPQQLVALISGFVSEELEMQAQSVGVAAVLMKADSIAELAKRVAELLRQRPPGH
jgi:two-component system, cell cycle sensor histidine kinase and response regulator CckA